MPEGAAFSMAGKDVFKHAVREMGDAVVNLLDREGVSLDDIDLVVPHQANKRIIDATADHACAYKPQFAYYAAENRLDELYETMAYLRAAAPGRPLN